jgi:hypothetical protein
VSCWCSSPTAAPTSASPSPTRTLPRWSQTRPSPARTASRTRWGCRQAGEGAGGRGPAPWAGAAPPVQDLAAPRELLPRRGWALGCPCSSETRPGGGSCRCAATSGCWPLEAARAARRGAGRLATDTPWPSPTPGGPQVRDMAKKASAAGIQTLVIDTENKFVSTGFAEEIAKAANGGWRPAPLLPGPPPCCPAARLPPGAPAACQ